MERWVRKCSSFAEEREADREFWRQLTPDERVEVVEQLRQEAWKVTGKPVEGLQRVVHIIQRPPR